MSSGREPRAFAVWAPAARTVTLRLREADVPMRVSERPGWFEVEQPAAHGDRYGFVLPDDPDRVLPDPSGTWLPEGVQASGAVYDHGRFTWADDEWAGRDLSDAVVYELHVGTFTRRGTFDGAVQRLAHLVALGITHVELMPVCSWDGERSWGYDGVALWSVHEAYGGPDGLKRFVDACHRHGLAVLLDVVHNHVGPSGNWLPRFGPYFTDAYATPWGAAVNLDGPGSDSVQDFLLGSVTQWLRDFHLDGLRLDAVHELHDSRALPYLEAMRGHVDALAEQLGRPLCLVAESDRNDPATVRPRSEHGLGMDAQWDDDVHHSLHALLTSENQGYYADFAADPFAAVAKVWHGAFFHDGTWSSFRGRHHGRPVEPGTPGSRFVVSLQTHDQVGNRSSGDRLSASLSDERIAAGATLLLTAPFVPMLFMGEEWGAATPWQFFTSYREPELGRLVRQGRQREFAEHGWQSSGPVPDPQDPETMHRSVLNWDEVPDPDHRRILAWYRGLITLRRSVPDLGPGRLGEAVVRTDPSAGWVCVHRGAHLVAVNLGSKTVTIDLERPAERVLLSWGEGVLTSNGPLGVGVTLPAGVSTVLRVRDP